MSAIIAWLLNPHMEHGLGYEFIRRFIEKLAEQNPQLTSLRTQLVNRLRMSSEDTDVLCDLEVHVQSGKYEAFIDVVLEIGDTIIAIENKIYADSASDPNQLVREYNGLKGMLSKERDGEKKTIVLVFLVPFNAAMGVLDPFVQKELDALAVTDGSRDTVQLVTWQKNSLDSVPSIYELISGLLTDEASGQTEPIPEYTRHTLKALNAFILNDFNGYDYVKKPVSSGINKLTQNIEDTKTLLEKAAGYVGVQYGVNGLLRMPREKLRNSKFQYTASSEIEGSRNWLKIDQFKKIVRWLLGGTVDNLDFSATVDGKTLYKIVSKCDNGRIYVGIKGGLRALQSMDANTIFERNYQIAAMSQNKNAQWFPGKDFWIAVTELGLWYIQFDRENLSVKRAESLVGNLINRFRDRFQFIVSNTHPCSEQYSCISLFAVRNGQNLHLLDFNIGGHLHIFHRLSGEAVEGIEPLDYLNVDTDMVFQKICHEIQPYSCIA